ncbi:hypothetical protein D8674_023886 [Pyrus ussuriensis x Pyrus communis]|uniref:Uncharacterized protein n=1 Tax=Pyrus ussuriensis x Pyrus communis TaxID=2448454 RepID=A0A5N5HEX8_9ROSA|nr:hypothetical protein D8674_023886 [Pyrus ussuriensis x Pyrus communis]
MFTCRKRVTAGNRQKKSSISCFSMFKWGRPRDRRGDDMMEDSYMSEGRVWAGDEDRGECVAEPGINNKAAAFIDRIRKKFEEETVKPDGKA